MPRPETRHGERPKGQRADLPAGISFDLGDEAIETLMVHDVRQSPDSDVLQGGAQVDRREMGVGRQRSERREREDRLAAAEPGLQLNAERAHGNRNAGEQRHAEPRSEQSDQRGRRRATERAQPA